MMELNSKSENKASESRAEKVELSSTERQQELVKDGTEIVGGGGGTDSASSDNEVFVSVKSINISGSDPDLPRLVTTTVEGLDIHNVSGSGGIEGNGDGNKEPFNVPDIKSETRVVVPRGCSDSHIGEGEGFHSSRLSSSASHGSASLSSAVFLTVGISSGGGEESGITGEAKNALVVVDNVKSDKREKCQSGNETVENVNTELGESLSLQQASSSTTSLGNTSASGKGKEKTLLGSIGGGGIGIEDVKPEPEETDIDLDTDLSIQVEHDLSVGNTEDFLDEELLEGYDEPDDELHRELEQIFETDLQQGVQGAVESGGGKKKSHKGRSSPSSSRHKRSKYVDSATWTQEDDMDDMPSPLSDLSPVQSPVKKKSSRSSGKRSSGVGSHGGGGGSGGSENTGHHQTGSQFDHQYQYQSYRGVGGVGHRSRHQASRQDSRSHQHNSRGIHQSQSNQRFGGGGSGEFIHHQPQQHHSQHPLPECFTVSSQLLSREAKLYQNVYENVPTTSSELETLEILLTGESCGGNYPTSGGGGGGSGRNSNSKASGSHQSYRNSHKNNGGGGGSSGSGGSSSTTNNNHLLPHSHHHHHHSASNLNSPGGAGSNRNSVEQLFSVSELLGPGSCLVVGGGCGPPSRTSWVDSGRESLSFDGENNNSGGSSRNLLLIPPPPPPPINYQGFTNSSIIMQNHHHVTSTQSPSHSGAHSSRKTGSRRLVRQKHAIDETFLPIPTNSTDNLGIDQGGMGGCGGGSGYLAIPSPRRATGMISNNMIASNFAGIAASPISLQRHPPASQIMLHENKKNKPLMPCETPYGIMSGGSGNMGTGDWGYGGGGGDGRNTDKKGGQLSRDLLRCRSPQRGRSRGKNSHNQSFDYGELPSHQMFPKRHLLTSRQLSSHNGQNHAGFPAGSTSNQIGNNNSAFILQPQNQHRSFPAGLFSGMTPKSCSMGDLTSSTASPNNQPHHNYQSFHGNGKASDQIALCPSGNALIGSLPLPPQTSVTYEFSLAPQSGTLAPGWNLTAVQRGLATAVPLAAAVARRRLPRPRPTRPRFGFTDKNEARRAKWTIVGTALALLFMSMLLVAITLRLAPLIDDMGSSSTSSGLSPTNKIHPSGGDAGGSGGIPHVCMDPYARRSSGAAAYIIRSAGNNPPYFLSDSGEHLPSSSPKFDSSRVRRSHGDIDIKRQISATLSIPSRENSVKSTSSKSTSGGQSSPVVKISPTNICYGYSTPMSTSPTSPNAIFSPSPNTLLLNNNFPETTPHFYRVGGSPGSSNCLAPTTIAAPHRGSRSSSIAQSGTGSHHRHHGEIEDSIKQKRQRKYVIAGFTFLVLVAVACVVISLGLSSQIEIPSVDIELPFINDTISDDDSQVRKENENLMRVIQQTSPNLNNMTHSNQSNSSTPSVPLQIEDQDESSGNYNNNNNNNLNGGRGGGGQSLTRSVITVDPGPGPRSSVAVAVAELGSEKADREGRSRRNESESSFNSSSNNPSPPPPPVPPIPISLNFDRDRDESGTLSSSLIAEILLSSSRSRTAPTVTPTIIGRPAGGGSGGTHNPAKDKSSVDNVMMADASATLVLGNSETSISAEIPNIYTEQIISDSDIDENVDRVRTSIVLR